MKKICRIAVVILFIALPAAAQDKRGDVVVHSDPRLSILMKKKKEVFASVTKPPVKHTAPVPATVSTTTVTTTAGGRVIAGTLPAHPGTPVTVPATTVTGHAVTGTPATNTPPVSGGTGTVPVAVPSAEVAHTKPEPAHPVVTAPIYIREKEGRVIYSGKGYRVLIYNGPDREKAIQIKTEFMRNFPGIRTYLSYVSPGYRVKVGNYRHREEALGMYKEAKGIYGPCVIVPDMITINTH